MPVYPRPLIQPLIQRRIYFVGGGSNKEYWVTIAKDTQGRWVVVGSWGRRHSVTQCKLYLETIDGEHARARANRLLSGKVGKGYRDVNGAMPAEFSRAEVSAWQPGSKTAASQPAPARPAAPMRPTVLRPRPAPVPVVSIAETLFG